jgi:hypothetical protein
MSPEISHLLRLLDQAYDKKSWHGPNLRGSLRGVTAEQASFRPNDERHSIGEIAVHAAYWKYVVRRRLLGEKRGSFPIKGSNWIKLPEPLPEPEWQRSLELLESVHQSLRGAVAQLSPSDLRKAPPKSSVTNLMLIEGIAFHDVYHAGQIQLLKRLSGAR